MSLTKSDIVDKIYIETGIPKKDGAELVDLVFQVMKETLAHGEKVKISGFGHFSLRDKLARKGRNPQTGESMEITARRVLTFKPSPLLKEDVTERFSHRIDEEGNEDTSIAPKEIRPRSLSAYVHEYIKEDD